MIKRIIIFILILAPIISFRSEIFILFKDFLAYMIIPLRLLAFYFFFNMLLEQDLKKGNIW